MAIVAEQEEKLSMLMAFAGDSTDAQLAKIMLESSGWDVERALNGLLEDSMPSESCEAPVAFTSPPDSSRVSTVEGQADELSTEDLRAVLDAYDVDHSMYSEKADLVNLLEKAIGNQAGPQMQPELGIPGLSIAPDTHLFTDPYPHPSIQASSELCEDFPENWAHRLKMICEKYPSASRSQVISLLNKHGGAACIVEHELEEITRVKEEQARQNAARQAEIDMQNQEYHESLLMDQHRELHRKEAQEAERRQVEELERKRAEEAQATRQAEIAFEAKRSRVDQPEPDKAHPDRTQIVIRTPSGKRLSRAFLATDEVAFIYDWIDVSCTGDDFVKETYRLVARLPGKPNMELCKSQQRLKDAGVENQSVFMVSCS